MRGSRYSPVLLLDEGSLDLLRLSVAKDGSTESTSALERKYEDSRTSTTSETTTSPITLPFCLTFWTLLRILWLWENSEIAWEEEREGTSSVNSSMSEPSDACKKTSSGSACWEGGTASSWGASEWLEQGWVTGAGWWEPTKESIDPSEGATRGEAKRLEEPATSWESDWAPLLAGAPEENWAAEGPSPLAGALGEFWSPGWETELNKRKKHATARKLAQLSVKEKALGRKRSWAKKKKRRKEAKTPLTLG